MHSPRVTVTVTGADAGVGGGGWWWWWGSFTLWYLIPKSMINTQGLWISQNTLVIAKKGIYDWTSLPSPPRLPVRSEPTRIEIRVSESHSHSHFHCTKWQIGHRALSMCCRLREGSELVTRLGLSDITPTPLTPSLPYYLFPLSVLSFILFFSVFHFFYI